MPCQYVGVPFKGMGVPSQVAKESIQGLGVSFQGMGVFGYGGTLLVFSFLVEIT